MLAPLVLLSLATTPGLATAAAPAPAQAAPAATPLDAATLAKLAVELRSPDAAVRQHAASTLAAAPPESFAALVARLATPRVSKPEILRKLILEIWAQVPNWKGPDPMWIHRPEPPWTPPPRVKGQPRAKRPPPHDPEAADWLTALNQVDLVHAAGLDVDAFVPLPPGQKKKAPSPAAPTNGTAAPANGAAVPAGDAAAPPVLAEWETARAEALEAVALIHAIAASRRLDAVDPIFELAFQYDGVFRDECGRQIRSMESYAVPGLVRLQHHASTKQQSYSKQRRYASYQLDRMDRARPAKAIQAAADDRVRAEIIHAYGEVQALEAVEAVLNQVDASSHRVRKEARWTWLRYVSGKAPPPAPKRKRKLPGGKEESEEKPDYLTYREIALLALQKQLEEINGEPVDARASAKQLTDQLFEYYDRKRAAEWDSLFTGAQAKAARGDVQAATDDFGWILAHDPNYARRAEMAPAFARTGDLLRERGDVSRALGYWRQAVDLAPDGPEARRAGARVALYDGLQALDHGYADVGAFRRALALDPSLDEARAGLGRAEAMRARRRWVASAGAVAAALALAFAVWLLWRRVGRAAARGLPADPPPTS